MEILSRRWFRILLLGLILVLVFRVYVWGLSRNPPGFYVDESALAYNAYLVAHTGAGEFGPRFPVYFQFFRDSWAQYVSPTQVYLLAVVFRILPPSILLARLFAAFWVFSACLLIGVLGKKLSGRIIVGVIVSVLCMLTPWFYDVSRLLLEPHFVPMAVVLVLLATYKAQKKERWGWLEVVLVAASLTLVAYCYQGGRLLVLLLAFGLVLFATSWPRVISLIKTWILFGITLIPAFLFNRRHPGALTKRLNEISYIRPGVPLRDILPQFIKRYLEDQNLTAMLMWGDSHPRHHVPGSGGAFYFATFALVTIGLAIVLARHWKNPWWQYVLYGLAVAVIPGAISQWPFHQMRLMAYPVFLMVLTIPAVAWLSGGAKRESDLWTEPIDTESRTSYPPWGVRWLVLCALLGLMGYEAYRYQQVFRTSGPGRTFEFDVPYKAAYEAAIKQPLRPIYLEDGKWGPGYIHALWYATMEKRPASEFVHLHDGEKAPPGKVVISSAETCDHCESITHSGVYHVYKTL